MATRSSIKSKNKAKLGAVAAAAVAGVTLTSEAAENDPLHISTPLLDAAFKLLEAGQQEALNNADDKVERFEADAKTTHNELDGNDLAALLPEKEIQMSVMTAMVDTGVVSDMPSQLWAQLDLGATAAGQAGLSVEAAATGAANAAGAVNAAGAAGVAGTASAASSAGAVAAGAAASGSGALVAFAPLASLTGIGAAAAGVAAVAVVNNFGSDTTGSDLADSKSVTALGLETAKVVNIVNSSSVDKAYSSSDTASTKVSLLGSALIDSHTHDFFGS